ncbi:MAG: aspartate/glutamate racemase family protein [Candidatus Aminicenantales bacterium]
MKFGIIIPSSNTVMEPELWRMASGWATIHTSRVRLQQITVDSLEATENGLSEAALLLADADVDVIGYGCTSGSLIKGKGHGRAVAEHITSVTGIPAVAAAEAVIEAVQYLNISRICIAAPYSEEILELERRFFEQNGMEVLKIEGLGMVENLEVGSQSPEIAYELAQRGFVPEAQGIFISCTNFRTLEVIDRLENELGVPVLSSNTATFWAMMRKAGVRRELEGYGHLFVRE